MDLTRRELIVLAGTAALAGCAQDAPPEGEAPPGFASGPIAAGTVRDYLADGIYGQHRDSHGFFIIREMGRLFAQSAICTHRACRLRVKGDGFLCPCHGSTFTRQGRVSQGPARRDLPRFRIEGDKQDRLTVYTDQPISPELFDQPGAFVAAR